MFCAKFSTVRISQGGPAFAGLLLSLALASCGGGSSSAPPLQLPPSPTPSSTATPTLPPTPPATPPPMLSGTSFRFYSFGGSYPSDILTASDGNVWFTQAYFGQTTRLTPSGQSTSYCVVGNNCGPYNIEPFGLARGGDGTLWFANRNDYSISNVALSGAFLSRLPVGNAGGPDQITFGSDGNLWFTQDNTPSIVGQMTPGGKYTGFAESKDVWGIVSGPDGNLWLPTGDGVLKLSTAGVPTFYPAPTGVWIGRLCVGSDGNIWAGAGVTPNGGAEILKITLSGVYKVYALGGFLGPTFSFRARGEVKTLFEPPKVSWQTTAIYSASGFVYFTETFPLTTSPPSNDIITQLSTNGNVAQQFQIPMTGQFQPHISSITLGADGNLWFVDGAGQTVDVWVLNAPRLSRRAGS